MSLQGGNFGSQANQGYLPGLQQNGLQGLQQQGGLGRQGWNQLVASQTGPGVNAAQAAVNLDPLYRAQRQGNQSFGLQGNGNQGFGLQGNGLQGNGNQGQFRSNWQQAISEYSRQTGVNAAQAAQALDQSWLGRGEAQANTPGTQRGGRRSRSNSGQFALQGAANGYNGNAGLQGGQIQGLDREGYQVLLSQLTGRGVNASQAAQMLNPIIRSQQEGRGLTPQEWNQMISQTTQQLGVNAAQAAQILDPYVRGRRESGTQYDVRGASISLLPNAGNGRGGFGSIGSDIGGKTSELAGLESNFGMYEGQRGAQSFRAGTPAESTDVVLDPSEATALGALQISQSPQRITNRSNNQTFNESDVSRIAQALGIQVQGLNKQNMVAAIKNATGSLSPRSQQQLLGNLTPRSQQLLRSF